MFKKLAIAAAIVTASFAGYIHWISIEPNHQELPLIIENQITNPEERSIVGVPSTSTLIYLIDVLTVSKNGGYMSSGILSKIGAFDNMSSWEQGVRHMTHDFAVSMQESFSKQNVNSDDDPALTKNVGKLNYDPYSYWMPASESEYIEARNAIADFQLRMIDSSNQTQFVARVGTLVPWLVKVEARLKSYSNQLSNSVETHTINDNLVGEVAATQSTITDNAPVTNLTPWMEVDNIFHNARGAVWALIHLMKAIEIDFAIPLATKNNEKAVTQIITELEASLITMTSPVVLNGSEGGIYANYSTTVANRINRASSGIQSLISSLQKD